MGLRAWCSFDSSGAFTHPTDNGLQRPLAGEGFIGTAVLIEVTPSNWVWRLYFKEPMPNNNYSVMGAKMHSDLVAPVGTVPLLMTRDSQYIDVFDDGGVDGITTIQVLY